MDLLTLLIAFVSAIGAFMLKLIASEIQDADALPQDHRTRSFALA